MSKKIDIFKSEEAEIKKKFESEGYDWEKVKKRLENIETREEVDKELTKLEGNIEVHYQYLKGLISDLESFKKEKGIVDVAKQKAEKKLKEKKAKAYEELRKKANKILPFGIGAFFLDLANDLIESGKEKQVDKESSFFGKFFGNIGIKIGVAILVGFKLKKGYDAWGNMKKDATEKLDAGKKTVETVKKVGEVVEQAEKGAEKFYYSAGIKTLSYFSGLSKVSNSIFTNIKDITFEELKRKDASILPKSEQKNQKIVDEFEEVKNHLVGENSENTNTLLRASLSKEKVDFILQKKSKFLEKRLTGDGLSKLKEKVGEANFSYEKLTFNEISVLLFAGFNSLGILGFESVKDVTKKGFSSVTDFIKQNNSLDEVSKELIADREDLISKEVVSGFWGLGGKGGKNYMKSSFEDLKEKFTNTDPEKQKKINEQLKSIIDFRDWLLDGFLDEKKHLLGEYQDDFTTNLDYYGVLLLYMTFSGKKNLDGVSTFDYPVMYKTLSWIIGKENAGRGSGYLRDVGIEIASKNNTEIFTQDEREALKIVGLTFATTWLDIVVEETKKNLGGFGLFDDKPAVSAATIGTGVLIWRYVGMVIPQARLLGLLTTLVGLSSLFSDLYSKNYSFAKDLQGIISPLTKKGGSEKKEIDLEKLITDLEKFNKKLVTEEIEVDGKKEKVLFYPGDNGLEVIYKNEIYKLDVGPIPARLKFNPEDIWDQLPNMQFGETVEYAGKDINFSKVRVDEEGKIIIGEKPNTVEYDKNKILDALKKGKIKHPKKLLSGEDYKEVEYLLVEGLKTSIGKIPILGERFKGDIILMKVGKLKTNNPPQA